MSASVDHKKVYGAGYHAGVKAAKTDGGKTRGRSRRYLNATNAMLCWNPESSEVALVPWPDRERRSDRYRMTTLACWADVRKKSFEQRKSLIFIEAIHLIVRDGCDPASVHFALLGLEEYRDGCSSDMPWMNDWV